MKKILIFIILVCIMIAQDLNDLNFGSNETFEVISWNIEWFPKNDQTTVDYVTEIIQSLDVDLIAIQEVDDTDMFDQMLSGLSNYAGYYESNWFAGLAYIYNTNTIEINDIYEIYITSEYWNAFPRSPMVMDLNFNGENIFVINNHYKCCGNGILELGNDGDEEFRRYTANNLLKEYIENYLEFENVIILGDLNDILTDEISNNVFQMFLEDNENYLFADLEIAVGNSSGWSYPGWPSHLDHILITNELIDNFNDANSDIQTIKIDEYLDGGLNEYDQHVSDHRPVGLKLQFDTSILGDLNNDDIINILDLVAVVNLVLLGEYDEIGDMNSNNSLNVIDIVILVNLILGE